MAKSLDKVLQPNGTYKWELVEPTASEKMGNGPETPATLVPGELGISESAPEKGVLIYYCSRLFRFDLICVW